MSTVTKAKEAEKAIFLKKDFINYNQKQRWLLGQGILKGKG